MTAPYRQMHDGNTAALRRYTMSDREDVLPAGEERCAHCGEPHEEGDLYRLGGDGDWMCVPCIRGTSDEWRRACQLMAQAAAILRLHTTQEAARVANELTLIVEGR